ncbi:hypothetical protein, partial [Streptomyces otsuchiensis]|uniref:hypothetical protein n=1 Tax=Streptomyces otsuchiensis TaxID=2681388 RepID=UPI001D1319E1
MSRATAPTPASSGLVRRVRRCLVGEWAALVRLRADGAGGPAVSAARRLLGAPAHTDDSAPDAAHRWHPAPADGVSPVAGVGVV